MENKTPMMQLLAQLRDERKNMPLNIEWDRCYQAIEMVIENTYIPLERKHIEKAFDFGDYNIDLPDGTWEQKYKSPEQYYNEVYKNK